MRRSSERSLEQRALVALLGAAGRLRREAGSILDEHGVSTSQYNVLLILKGAGGALPTMTIRDRMTDREPSITRLVDRLVERGLVERIASAEDRRRVDCHITDAGLELLSQLDGPVTALDRRLLQGLSEPEMEELIELLARVGGEEVA